MAPSAVDDEGLMTNGMKGANGTNGDIVSENGFTRHQSYDHVDTMNPHESVHFDPSLQPKKYHIKGTDADSKVLFRNVNILDSTGRDPFKGDVYIEGEVFRIIPTAQG